MRFDRVRPIRVATLIEQIRALLDLVREYRRGWTSDARARNNRRAAVQEHVPPVDWLWKSTERASLWVDSEILQAEWLVR